jgi:hypothetical protein
MYAGALACLLVLGQTHYSFAFAAPPDSIPSNSENDPCKLFKKNADKTWSPLQQLTITSGNGSRISISPGFSFGSGVQFLGMNLAEQLDRDCKGKSVGYPE